jgi:hypothetical protein
VEANTAKEAGIMEQSIIIELVRGVIATPWL